MGDTDQVASETVTSSSLCGEKDEDCTQEGRSSQARINNQQQTIGREVGRAKQPASRTVCVFFWGATDESVQSQLETKLEAPKTCEDIMQPGLKRDGFSWHSPNSIFPCPVGAVTAPSGLSFWESSSSGRPAVQPAAFWGSARSPDAPLLQGSVPQQQVSSPHGKRRRRHSSGGTNVQGTVRISSSTAHPNVHNGSSQSRRRHQSSGRHDGKRRRRRHRSASLQSSSPSHNNTAYSGSSASSLVHRRRGRRRHRRRTRSSSGSHSGHWWMEPPGYPMAPWHMWPGMPCMPPPWATLPGYGWLPSGPPTDSAGLPWQPVQSVDMSQVMSPAGAAPLLPASGAGSCSVPQEGITQTTGSNGTAVAC